MWVYIVPSACLLSQCFPISFCARFVVRCGLNCFESNFFYALLSMSWGQEEREMGDGERERGEGERGNNTPKSPTHQQPSVNLCPNLQRIGIRVMVKGREMVFSSLPRFGLFQFK